MQEATYPVKGTVKIQDASGEEDWHDLWRDVELKLNTIEAPPDVIVNERSFWSKSELEKIIREWDKDTEEKDFWTQKDTEFIAEHCADGRHKCFFPQHRITHTVECGNYDVPKSQYQIISKSYTNPPKRDGKKLKVGFYGRFDTLRQAQEEALKIIDDPARETYDTVLFVEKIIKSRTCRIRETTDPASKPFDKENHRVKGYLVFKTEEAKSR